LQFLQGIPRTVTLDSKTDVSLIQWPNEEVNALRGAKLSMTELQLDAGAVVEVESAAGGQLDVEVVFEYPNISAVGVVEEANFDDNFDCSQGGSAHHGVLGPFGLLVLTDNDFQEQTALFFYLHIQMTVNGPQDFAVTRADHPCYKTLTPQSMAVM
jgi:hypothetical protein